MGSALGKSGVQLRMYGSFILPTHFGLLLSCCQIHQELCSEEKESEYQNVTQDPEVAKDVSLRPAKKFFQNSREDTFFVLSDPYEGHQHVSAY